MTATLHNSGSSLSFAKLNPISSALAGLQSGPGALVALVAPKVIVRDADVVGLVTGAGPDDWFHTMRLGPDGLFDDDGLVGCTEATTWAPTLDDWHIVALTWGTGAGLERFSHIDLTAAGSWAHGDSTGNNGGNRSGPSTSTGIFQIGYMADGIGEVDIGLVAAWAGVRPSDAQVEALSASSKTSDLWNSAIGHPTTLVECTSTTLVDLGANPSTFSSIGGLTLDGSSPPWTYDGVGSPSTKAPPISRRFPRALLIR